jgi:hypothetical protein
MRRIYWFAPFNKRRVYEGRKNRPPKARKLQLNHVRPDGPAFAEIQAAFLERGWTYGGLLPNSPPSLQDLAVHGQRPPLLPNDGSLTRGDLVVMVGNPAPHALQQKDPVRIERGHTTLEQKTEEILAVHYEVLARSHIRLTEPYARLLRPGYENRADITFTKYGDFAWYHECECLNKMGKQQFDRKDRRTAVYVLNLPEIPSLRGAGLFLAFGPSGNHTLALCYRLRTDLGHLLEAPNFTILEISNAEQPARPTDLRFVSDWTFETILQAQPRVPTAPRRPQQRPPPPAGQGSTT